MKTKVVQLRRGSASVRTVIPQAYVQLLELKNGDELDWSHLIDRQTGEITLKLKKATD